MTTQHLLLLYAKALLEIEVEFVSSEEEGLRGSNAFANNGCELCFKIRTSFLHNMASWPPKNHQDPFPYHAWSGPDFDPDVQDVHITSILEHAF